MGIATILETKKIILLAGKNKKQIIKKLLTCKINSNLPASYLKLHNNCTILFENSK